MKNIWMYWENKRPAHIARCIESVRRHKGRCEFHLLDSDSISRFLPNLRPEWHTLKKAAHKADYVRTRLVHQYGGMWIDCDMIALADIEPLFEFPEHLDYACQNIAASIGCFIARPGCKILEKIIAEQDSVLDNKLGSFGWNDIGNTLLRVHGSSYPHHRWEEWTLDEISGAQTVKLFSRCQSIDANVSTQAVLFHLCNEGTGNHMRRYLRPGRLLCSHMLVSKLFRRSFGLEEPTTQSPEWLEFVKDYDVVDALTRSHVGARLRSKLQRLTGVGT